MKLTATFSYITYLLLVISAATGTFASPVKRVDPSLTGFRNVGYFGNWVSDIYEIYSKVLLTFVRTFMQRILLCLKSLWTSTLSYYTRSRTFITQLAPCKSHTAYLKGHN
jgi:hypothetical protein